MQTDTDAQLTRRGQAGDRQALDAIYRRYQPLVAATARRLLHEAADADDTVQETFLIVFERIAQLADPAALAGWIVRIAARRAHRVFRVRRLARKVWHDDPHPVIERQASRAARPDLVAELALFERTLDMPIPLGTAWLLRHAGGIALEDIAARCACSVATVKRRLIDAQAIIERHVERHVAHRSAGADRPRAGRRDRGGHSPAAPEARRGATSGQSAAVSMKSRVRDQFHEP